MRALDIWITASEAAPLAQTGGLADVLRALPPALARRGHHVRVFLPAYGSIDRRPFRYEPDEDHLAVPVGVGRVPVRLLSMVGDDHFGDEMLSGLGVAGVDTRAEEDRPFRPHVTVARARGRARLPAAFGALVLGLDWNPEGVELLESEVGPGGSRYACLERFPFPLEE